MPVVQFAPFSSLVQPAFWHELTNLKIDVLRLSQESIPISASYTLGRSVTDRETGQEVALGCNMTIGADAFNQAAQPPAGSIAAHGVFKNYNTIEEFKAADKTALFNQVADEIWTGVRSTGDITLLNRYLLITFADLKKYRYYYWFAFPAFVAKPAWTIADPGWRAAEEELGHDALESIHQQLCASQTYDPYFLVRISANGYEIAPISSYSTFFTSIPLAQQLICFTDPSALPQNPGWPLRNLLAFLRAQHHSDTSSRTATTFRVLCWRDAEVPATGKPWKSRFGVVEAGVEENPSSVETRPPAVGWEKNPQGKTAPRVADLAPMMDPKRLADQAVDLNLKLMRWRILPALDLEKVASTRCLLLGAGTLGCYVARTLMGWGVRTITFVDSARVSFSNPVRQPLFEFEDCLQGGKPKAQCAADSLKRIFPGVNATGVSMSIPMPGHPIPPASVEQAKKNVADLEKLFDDHDAVFLLMDSRESRWLPTVLGAAKGKIVMNAALGFDTFLVMRHGARAAAGSPPSNSASTAASTISVGRLGCYYCNDIVAPADSLTDRTLDQMCTVTRPGLASIASATAVELLISLLQHPDGVNARAPPPDAKEELPGDTDPYRSVLGLVPHQLRGFLAQFRTMPIVGAAYHRCTGCSETILRAYETEGFDMLLRAFNEPGYLETMTGLDKLHEEGEAAFESVDWDEEEEEF